MRKAIVVKETLTEKEAVADRKIIAEKDAVAEKAFAVVAKSIDELDDSNATDVFQPSQTIPGAPQSMTPTAMQLITPC